MKRIIRVFPRHTAATPDDELARIAVAPSVFDEADEVYISVAFTWDIPLAEQLAAQWSAVAPVKVGGPAYHEPGGDFVPGITRTGCTFCGFGAHLGSGDRFHVLSSLHPKLYNMAMNYTNNGYTLHYALQRMGVNMPDITTINK